jgi:hypothetical protein
MSQMRGLQAAKDDLGGSDIKFAVAAPGMNEAREDVRNMQKDVDSLAASVNSVSDVDVSVGGGGALRTMVSDLSKTSTSMRSLASTSSESMQSIRSDVSSTAQQVNAMTEANEANARSSVSVGASARASFGRVEGAITSSASAADRLGDSLSGVDNGASSVAKTVGDVDNSVGSLGKSVADLGESGTQSLQSIGAAASKSGSDFGFHGKAVNDAADAQRALTADAQRSAGAVSELTRETGNYGNKLAEVSEARGAFDGITAGGSGIPVITDLGTKPGKGYGVGPSAGLPKNIPPITLAGSTTPAAGGPPPPGTPPVVPPVDKKPPKGGGPFKEFDKAGGEAFDAAGQVGSLGMMGAFVGGLGVAATAAVGLGSVYETMKQMPVPWSEATQAVDQFNHGLNRTIALGDIYGNAESIVKPDAFKALGAAMDSLGAEVGHVGLDNMNTAISTATDFVNQLAPALDRLQPAIAPAIKGLGSLGDAVVQGLSSPGAVQGITALGNTLSDPKVEQGIAGLVSGAITSGGVLGTVLGNVAGAIGPGGGPAGQSAIDGAIAGAMMSGKGLVNKMVGAGIGAVLMGAGAYEQSQGMDPTAGFFGGGLGALAASTLKYTKPGVLDEKTGEIGEGERVPIKGAGLGGAILGEGISFAGEKLEQAGYPTAGGMLQDTGYGASMGLLLSGGDPVGAAVGGGLGAAYGAMNALAEAHPAAAQKVKDTAGGVMHALSSPVGQALSAVTGMPILGGLAAAGTGIEKLFGGGETPGGAGLPIPDVDQGVLPPGTGAASKTVVGPGGTFAGSRDSSGTTRFQNVINTPYGVGVSDYTSTPGGPTQTHSRMPSADGGWLDTTSVQGSPGGGVGTTTFGEDAFGHAIDPGFVFTPPGGAAPPPAAPPAPAAPPPPPKAAPPPVPVTHGALVGGDSGRFAGNQGGGLQAAGEAAKRAAERETPAGGGYSAPFQSIPQYIQQGLGLDTATPAAQTSAELSGGVARTTQDAGPATGQTPPGAGGGPRPAPPQPPGGGGKASDGYVIPPPPVMLQTTQGLNAARHEAAIAAAKSSPSPAFGAADYAGLHATPNVVTHAFDPTIAYHGLEAAKTGYHTFDTTTGLELNRKTLQPLSRAELNTPLGPKAQAPTAPGTPTTGAAFGKVVGDVTSIAKTSTPTSPYSVFGRALPAAPTPATAAAPMGPGRAMASAQDLGRYTQALNAVTNTARTTTTANNSLAKSIQTTTPKQQQQTPTRTPAQHQTQNNALAQSFSNVGQAANKSSDSMNGLGKNLGKTTQSMVAMHAAVPGMASVSGAVAGASVAANAAATSGMGKAGAAGGAALASGIGHSTGQAHAAGAAAASAGAAGAAGASGSHSPSTVMMQIGEWMGEGLEIGLRDSSSQVASAAGQLIQSAVSATNSAIQGVYNQTLSGGFGAGIIAASNGVTPIAQDYGLMIGYAWAQNVVTGAQTVLQSSEFTALTVPKFGSALAQSTLGGEGLLPPAGSGAEYYQTTSGSAGMVSMTPTVTIGQITVSVGGQQLQGQIDGQIDAKMVTLANSIGQQRG